MKELESINGIEITTNVNNTNIIAIVTAESENKASSILDNYLEDNYPEIGREECYYDEGDYYYFILVY